jgi:hypothetical protein
MLSFKSCVACSLKKWQKMIQKCENDMDQYVVSCKACYGIVNSQVVIAKIYVNVPNSSIHHKLLNFIGLYRFYVKSDFHRFIQKSHEFDVMVNLNDICTYSIS